MSKAIVFPGQGSQAIGMGKDLHAAFASARAVFQEIDDALHQNLSQLMFEGSPDELTMTENAQPALMAVSLAVVRVLEQDFGIAMNQFHCAAGHSLGEYSALAAVGSLDIATTARLLKLRGQAMQRAVAPGEGGMVAILGADLDKVQEIATLASQEAFAKAAADTSTDMGSGRGKATSMFGTHPDHAANQNMQVMAHTSCNIANDNSPGQVVLSGAKPAMEAATEIAKSMNVKCISLKVSAPFHCPLMAPAAAEMERALADVVFKTPIIPVYPNVLAHALKDISRFNALLVQQITGQVRWRETIQNMAKDGVTQIVEVGSGKVLAGLTKRINPDLKAFSLGTPQEIEDFVKTLN